jgi:hypothetical protein
MEQHTAESLQKRKAGLKRKQQEIMSEKAVLALLTEEYNQDLKRFNEAVAAAPQKPSVAKDQRSLQEIAAARFAAELKQQEDEKEIVRLQDELRVAHAASVASKNAAASTSTAAHATPHAPAAASSAAALPPAPTAGPGLRERMMDKKKMKMNINSLLSIMQQQVTHTYANQEPQETAQQGGFQPYLKEEPRGTIVVTKRRQKKKHATQKEKVRTKSKTEKKKKRKPSSKSPKTRIKKQSKMKKPKISDEEEADESSQPSSGTDSEGDEQKEEEVTLEIVLGSDRPRWVHQAPACLDRNTLVEGKILCRLFDTGWSRGVLVKGFKSAKKSNCDIHWLDEPKGMIRGQLLQLREYYACEVDGVRPPIGAWFFLQ